MKVRVAVVLGLEGNNNATDVAGATPFITIFSKWNKSDLAMESNRGSRVSKIML